MRLSRDLVVIFILFTLLIGLAVASAVQNQQRAAGDNPPPYSAHSTGDLGTAALQAWMDALGYRTRRIENQDFFVADDTRVLLIIAPAFNSRFDNRQIQNIRDWVARGNTLIIADDVFFASDAFLRAWDIDLASSSDVTSTARVDQPIFGLTANAEIVLPSTTTLNVKRNDYVTYLDVNGKPALISFKPGRGTVWVSSAPYLFTNEGLRDERVAALVSALWRDVPNGSVIAFDEYHHGYTNTVANEEPNLQMLIYTTPWGWGIIFAFVVIFAYLFVNGRRFGRVLPLPRDIARRSPAEYVMSMAQLFRRAGKRHFVLQHYRRQLKRALGRPFRLNPDLPDDEFLYELARVRDDLDRDELARTLRELNQKQANERTAVKLADQAVNLMEKKRI